MKIRFMHIKGGKKMALRKMRIMGEDVPIDPLIMQL